MKKKLFLGGILSFGVLLFAGNDMSLASSVDNNATKSIVVDKSVSLPNLEKSVSIDSGESLKSKEIYESQITSIKNDISTLNNLKVLYQTDRESLTRDINELELEISEKENLISALLESISKKESEISETESEIVSLLKEIVLLEKEKSLREESFKGRVSSIYKNKELNVIDVLIESDSFGDMINRFFNYKTIVDADNQAIEEYLELLERLDSSKKELDELKVSLEKQVSDLLLEKDKAETEKSKLSDLLVEKERQSMSTDEIIADINKSIKTLSGSISILKSNIDKSEIEKALKARVAREVSDGIKNKIIYKYADLSNIEHISASVEKEIELGKMFITPTEGRFTSGYGPRIVNGEYGVHMGIDLANKTGTNILASAEGTVLHAGPYSTYGNAIFIHHNIDGKDFVTVYGHLSVVGVQKGDKVEQGQIIGLMGNTGRSFGSHLHFEIQPNTSKFDYSKGIDPWRYLTSTLSDNILRNGFKSIDKIKDTKSKDE